MQMGLGIGINRGNGAGIPQFPADNAISLWLFGEGSGTTVNDEIGSNDINLSTPTTPNYTWTAQGLSLALGLVQTPSITNAREVIILYKTGLNESTGFIISGGASSGSGVLQENSIAAETVRMASSGYDWHTLYARSDNGTSAYENNRGGWCLMSRLMTTQYTSIFGFGGRHSTTTSRCPNFEIAMAAVYSQPTTEAQRNQLLAWARHTLKERGIYFHRADPPTRKKVFIILGESNADGRADIVNLTAGQQAADYTGVVDVVTNATVGSVFMTASATLDLGVNQQATNPTIDFGPEIGLALSALAADDDTVILKNGVGSTFLSSDVSHSGGAAFNWNPSRFPAGSLFWQGAFRNTIWRGMQTMLNDGVGWGSVRIGMWIGLNDAASTTYAPSVAAYQGYLQDFWDTIKAQMPNGGLHLVLFRAHPSDPSANATALANVRGGSDAFAAANPSDVTLVDTDSLGLLGDSVHYNAAATVTMGGQLYA